MTTISYNYTGESRLDLGGIFSFYNDSDWREERTIFSLQLPSLNLDLFQSLLSTPAIH